MESDINDKVEAYKNESQENPMVVMTGDEIQIELHKQLAEGPAALN